MPFCYAPWTNIDILPQGDIAPCCKFRNEYYATPPNLTTSSVDMYLNSKTLQTIRKNFQDDVWPTGCERCRIEEENGIESKRQLDYQRWRHLYDKYDFNRDGFLTASVAFGNTCNLKCITCGPNVSSAWRKEFYEIYGIDIKSNDVHQTDFFDHLQSKIYNLRHLDIVGGEPFVSAVDKQKQWLRSWIDQGQAQDISLHYTTNGTFWPDQEWWDLWIHFRNVDLQISIDGLFEKFEYIRYPAKWSVLCENVDKYLSRWQDNIQISVSHTVSAFNIYYIDEFFTWCSQIGLPRPWCGRVHNPNHMRPTVWKPTASDCIASRLLSSSFSDVRLWANLLHNEDDSRYFDDFVRAIENHDQYRGISFEKTFPELAPWIVK